MGHNCYRRIPVDGRRYFVKNAEKRAFFSYFFLLDALSTNGVDDASKKGRRESGGTFITIVCVLSLLARRRSENGEIFSKITVERGAATGKNAVASVRRTKNGGAKNWRKSFGKRRKETRGLILG